MTQVGEPAFLDGYRDGDGCGDETKSGEGLHGGRLEESESSGDLKNGRRV